MGVSLPFLSSPFLSFVGRMAETLGWILDTFIIFVTSSIRPTATHLLLQIWESLRYSLTHLHSATMDP
ncbi:hypothetical protein WAI453_007229 [Rhynchosporium graminicola]